MNMIIFEVIVFAIAGLLLGFSDNTNGTYSRLIGVAAGLIWLGGIISGFWKEGLTFGILAILGSFVIAAVTMNIGKRVALKLRKSI